MKWHVPLECGYDVVLLVWEQPLTCGLDPCHLCYCTTSTAAKPRLCLATVLRFGKHTI